MTPESAQASINAAREAGWYGNSYKGRMTAAARQRISDGMPKSENRALFLALLEEHGTLITKDLAAKANINKSTAHSTLARMEKEGLVLRKRVTRDKRRQAAWKRAGG